MKSDFVSFGSECASAHGVGQLVFHLEWCPKYRYNMLRKQRYKDLLAQQLLREAQKIQVQIVEMAIGDDHVHVVVCLRPSRSVSSVLHQLKGASSHFLFRMEPKFRFRYPRGSFWSPGKFYRSIGDTDIETTRAYVKAQDHKQQNLKQFMAQAA